MCRPKSSNRKVSFILKILFMREGSWAWESGPEPNREASPKHGSQSSRVARGARAHACARVSRVCERVVCVRACASVSCVCVSVGVRVYVSVRMSACVCTCVCIRECVCLRVYVHVCVSVGLCVYVCASVCTHSLVTRRSFRSH